MERFGTAALGLLTLIPAAWTGVCALRIVQWWTGAPFEPDEVMLGGDAAKITSEHFALVLTGSIAVAAITIALLVACLLHAASSPRIADEQRGMWCALLILGMGFTLPVYWWMNLRAAAPRRVEAPPRDPAAASAPVRRPEAPAGPLWQPSRP